MKIAKTPDGKSITASDTAPKKAICPYCNGILILRSRRPMNNGKATFYWRHGNNQNANCSARRRPV